MSSARPGGVLSVPLIFIRVIGQPKPEKKELDAEYDSMAEEYDATREAATEAEIRAITKELEGCKSILDVGVGTARFAKPLSDLGFEVTGIDILPGGCF